MQISQRVRRGAVVVAAVAIVAFGWFVWPTPFRSAVMPRTLQNRTDGVCCYAARVNRFTSEVQVLTVVGWQTLSLTKDSATAKATAALIMP